MNDVLGAIMTAHPLCRRCDNPADFNVAGTLLCAECFKSSSFATGQASSGDDVTAGADLPPNPVSPAVTDPFKLPARKNAAASRSFAFNPIEPKEAQVSSDG